MAAAVAELNEILSEERACVWILRQARFRCYDASQIEVIQSILDGYDHICVELEHTIGALGGEPTEMSSERPATDGRGESLVDKLKAVEALQQHVITKIDTVIAEPGLERCKQLLLAIRQFHFDNLRWLAEALGAS